MFELFWSQMVFDGNNVLKKTVTPLGADERFYSGNETFNLTVL